MGRKSAASALRRQRLGGGEIEISNTALECIDRPKFLVDVPEAYGLMITEHSMCPAFRPGDTAWVHPRLPPILDTEVVISQRSSADAPARAVVCSLLTITSTNWVVQRINPRAEFSLARAAWPRCERIIGKLARC